MNTQRILDIIANIRSSQGWQEDHAAEWLGPSLHEIEDIVNVRHTTTPVQEQIEWLHDAKRGLSHPTQAQYNTLWRTFAQIK